MKPRNAITERLAQLQSWRYGLNEQIARVDSTLRDTGLLTPESARVLDQLLQSVASACLSIAVVGESGRGKSELINALLFAETGRRVLPTGPGRRTCCVTEIRYDRFQETGLRLMPIETREDPRPFDALYRDPEVWRRVPFNAGDADSTGRALASLMETKRVSVAEAISWGLRTGGKDEQTGTHEGTWVEVPRWRYAILNFPHPLLDAGLMVIDTPGLGLFASEPELVAAHLLSCDAVMFVFDALLELSTTEREIWRDYFPSKAAAREMRRTSNPAARFAALNQIDRLEGALDPEPDQRRKWLTNLDGLVRGHAERLQLEPIDVIPVSAVLAYEGKSAGNTDRMMQSRLYQVERRLASKLDTARHESVRMQMVNQLADMIDDHQSELDRKRFAAVSGLHELGIVRSRNLQLMSSITHQTESRKNRLNELMQELRHIRTLHSSLAGELAEAVNIKEAQSDIDATKQILVKSLLPGSVEEAVNHYLETSANRLITMQHKIDEIRALFDNIAKRIRADFGGDSQGVFELHPFSTGRFPAELAKVRQQATEEFGAGNLRLSKRGQVLADTFEASIGARVLNMFNIANRESSSWMRGVYAALEKSLGLLQKRMDQRGEQLQRVQSAELDLADQIAELQAKIDKFKSYHAALASAREGLLRFSGEEPALKKQTS